MPTANTRMQGKVCLITGANSGIGYQTALELARMGATVVMVCRNRAKGEAAQSEIKAKSGNANIDLLLADLSSQQSIHQLAANFKQRYTQLHVLVNNAGLFSMQRKETVDGIEMTLAVNLLAPFLLTNLLLDVLKASAPARIVNVSSEAQAINFIDMNDLQGVRKYGGWRAYGQSKLALVLFTYELARKLQGTGVTANCLHPGFVATNFAQSDMAAPLRALTQFVFSLLAISPERGAQTSLYLASSPDVEDITGKYFDKSIPKRSVARSYDESLQRALWKECAELTKQPLTV